MTDITCKTSMMEEKSTKRSVILNNSDDDDEEEYQVHRPSPAKKRKRSLSIMKGLPVSFSRPFY
jgi:hypothetical protein